MSVTLFSANLLEGATVTVTPTPAYPERLYDRDYALPMVGAAVFTGAQYGLFPLPLYMVNSTITIDIDLGSATAVTQWAILGHTLAGTVTLLSGASSPAATSRDSFTAVSGTDSLRTIASVSARYWRITAPAGSIGEVMLGTTRSIENPNLPTGQPHTLGNVRSWLSPGWTRWGSRLSGKRKRLVYRWNAIPTADLTTYESFFDDVNQGAKAFLLQDAAGALRWVYLATLEIAPDALGNGLFTLEATFEEAQAQAT